MSYCKLVLRNVRRNLQDYRIYFLTLVLAVSLVYAFNSIGDQPAFTEMSMTRALLYSQLDKLLAVLSAALCLVLAFLILYANQFLLRRRKKELGLYRLLGMRPGPIARLFAGETLCIGAAALGAGLVLGFLFSQGVSLVALRLFAVELERFRVAFSPGALRQTAACFGGDLPSGDGVQRVGGLPGEAHRPADGGAEERSRGRGRRCAAGAGLSAGAGLHRHGGSAVCPQRAAPLPGRAQL